LVYSMRIGDVFAINCDNLNLDFNNEWTHSEIFPTDEISEFDEWREDESYMKVVKPEENVDLIGNKKCYMMNEKFQMVFLYRYTSDEDMVRIVDNIPNSDQMRFIITERQSEPTAHQQANQPSQAQVQSNMELSYSAYDDSNCYGVGAGTFDVYERQYEQQLKY